MRHRRDRRCGHRHGRHLAAIKKFPDFAYQDKWQPRFDNEYDLLPATQSAAASMAKSNPMFAAFLSNITNSVNYPALGTAAGRRARRGAGADEVLELAAGGVPVFFVLVVAAPFDDRGQRDVQPPQ
jgi:hypothetical protein